MKKNIRTALVVLIFSVSMLPLFLISKMYGESYPVLGVDPLYGVKIIEDHKEALKHWIDKGISNAVLVNIDAHDDMRPVAADVLEKMKNDFYKKQPISSTSATNSNFIHAAAKLGVVKKVIWVVPSSFDLFSDSGSKLNQLLKMYGFPDKDIATFRNKDGRYVGTADNIPLIICDIFSLPKVREPILLSVDVDYFPAMVTEDLNITKPLKETFRRVFDERYELRDAVVSYSVSGGYMSTSYRWVGDFVVHTLNQPMLISQLPPRYSFMQKAALYLQMERYQELLMHLSRIPEQEVSDPGVFMYEAQAYQGLGNMPKSFEYAEKACVLDRNYCYGLPELGAAVLSSGGLADARKFFDRGYQLRSDMDHSQFNYAMALITSGRYDEAIKQFEVFRDHNGPFPVDFYIAEAFRLKKDDASTLKYYDSARKELAGNPAALAGFGDISVIKAAAKFYEEKGYVAYASELKGRIGYR